MQENDTMKGLRLLVPLLAVLAVTLACTVANSAQNATPAYDIYTITPAGAARPTENAASSVIVPTTPTPQIPITGGGGGPAAFVDEVLQQLTQGRLAYNPPSEMTVGQT